MRQLSMIVLASALAFASPSHAVLQPRDLDGNRSVDAWYDPLHGQTWMDRASSWIAQDGPMSRETALQEFVEALTRIVDIEQRL